MWRIDALSPSPGPLPADAVPEAFTQGPAILRVEGARFSFGSRPVLRGLDLVIGSGEIYALLGPNGAGKTTLVRALCGRVALDGGLATVMGLKPHLREARKLVGLVPQEIALYPRLTGRENLATFAALMGMRRRDVKAAVEGVLDRTGVRARADGLVSMLSGGWRRRFNIAAGLMHNPRLLILDEPTVGIDVDARAAIHETLAGLRGDGMAILLITHDLDQVLALADRAGVMVDGRMRIEDRPDKLLDRWLTQHRHEAVGPLSPFRPGSGPYQARASSPAPRPNPSWQGPANNGEQQYRRPEALSLWAPGSTDLFAWASSINKDEEAEP